MKVSSSGSRGTRLSGRDADLQRVERDPFPRSSPGRVTSAHVYSASFTSDPLTVPTPRRTETKRAGAAPQSSTSSRRPVASAVRNVPVSSYQVLTQSTAVGRESPRSRPVRHPAGSRGEGDPNTARGSLPEPSTPVPPRAPRSQRTEVGSRTAGRRHAASTVTRKRKRTDTFDRYIYGAFHLAQPLQAVSLRSIQLINTLVHHVLIELIRAGRAALYPTRRLTLTERNIEAALRATVPDSVTRHRLRNAGRAAVVRYLSFVGTVGTGPVRQSVRAGIVFPVARVAHLMRDNLMGLRLSRTAPVFVSAVLEVLAVDVLTRASLHASHHGHTRVKPEDVTAAWPSMRDLYGLLLPLRHRATNEVASPRALLTGVRSLALDRRRRSPSLSPPSSDSERRKSSTAPIKKRRLHEKQLSPERKT